MAKLNAGLHTLVIISSIGNLLLKIIIIGVLATVKADDLKNSLSRFRNFT